MEQQFPLDSIGDERFRALCEAAVEGMQRLHVPGVAIGVADGDTEHVAGFGVTNIDHPLPVDGDTLFQIGSTSKTITGTAALRLAERGLLDLDAPIRNYLPDLRLADAQVAAHVTLRHLFNHTGGWAGDYFDDLGHGEDALARIVANMANLPQLTPLGTIWSYNNAGFYLAGRVLEVVAGQPFEALVHELVLEPLGMDHSFFFPGDIMTYRFAVGHVNSFEAGEPPALVARPWPLARTAHPAGGVSSTARDQLRYARFHMGDGIAADGTRLLKAESLALMQTPTVPAANGEKMGVTWFVREIGGTRVLRHGGATLGQKSAFVFVPARKFAIAVLTNADRGVELHQEITQLALKLFLGLEDRQPAPSSLEQRQLEEYAGRYTALLDDCELSARDGQLIMQYLPHGGFPAKDSPAPPTPPAVRLAGCGPDSVIVLDEPFKQARGEFLRGPGGEIAWLRFGGRIHRRAS